MKLPDPENLTNDILMLWVMHKFSEVFKNHAILKGGMQLMLLSSERATNDLDYVFVPYRSKKEIEPNIDSILSEIPDCKIEKSFHSNAGKYRISVGKAAIQIKLNVDLNVPSTAITTDLLASKLGTLPKIIRVMAPEVAFAHKLAAWNERRLLRDLYDIYYLYAIVKILPDKEILKKRLNKINSQLPRLKKKTKMSLFQFIDELTETIDLLTDDKIQNELRPLLRQEKLNGLAPIMKVKLTELISEILKLNETI